MSNFAPYQDEEPGNHRSRSPSPPPPNAPHSQSGDRLPEPAAFENNAGLPRSGFGNGVGADERNVDVFSTSLPLRLDYEACLAYLALPPAGPAVLLMLEHKSDYVRFHAWQSSLLFTCLFVFHLIFSFTKVVSFLVLAADLVLMLWLTLHAYRDAETMERFELPWFGRIASNFVDAE